MTRRSTRLAPGALVAAPALALALALAFTLAPACATPLRDVAPDAAYPGTLRDPATLPGSYLLRQKVKATLGEHTLSYEAVLQKQGGTLTLIGLAPHGGKAYVLEQTGQDVRFKSYVPRKLPFSPRFMLLDVQRTYYLGLEGAPLSDGDHEATRDGEVVTERWEGGRLMARTFRRVSGEPPGTIAVTYVGGMTPTEMPTTIELDNGWFDYHLTITTLSRQALGPEDR